MNETASQDGYIDRCLKLYSTGDYYVPRPLQPEAAQEYWSQKVDPDGIERDLEAERDVRRGDVAYIADVLNGLAPGRILDVGCGLGELLEQIDTQHDLYGVDTSEKSIQVCRSRIDGHFNCCVLNDVPGEWVGFAVVVANHVIEHVEDPVDFVRTIFSMLKPGGLFICGTPDFSSAAARRFKDRFRLLHDPTHVSLFTEDSLLRLFRDTGFIVERVEKPFFDTRFDTEDAYRRMQENVGTVSPPFYGSFVTVFGKKPIGDPQ